MFDFTECRYEAAKTEAVNLLLFDTDLNERIAASVGVLEQ